jgi:hypothetical protein
MLDRMYVSEELKVSCKSQEIQMKLMGKQCGNINMSTWMFIISTEVAIRKRAVRSGN